MDVVGSQFLDFFFLLFSIVRRRIDLNDWKCKISVLKTSLYIESSGCPSKQKFMYLSILVVNTIHWRVPSKCGFGLTVTKCNIFERRLRKNEASSCFHFFISKLQKLIFVFKYSFLLHSYHHISWKSNSPNLVCVQTMNNVFASFFRVDFNRNKIRSHNM